MARQHFQINEADLGQDELSAVIDDGGMTVSIEEPWAGDTETGFGRNCSIYLEPKTAREFALWILKHIGD